MGGGCVCSVCTALTRAGRTYKDRHYFGEEAPELLGACARAFARGEAVEPRLLECGCGAGNTVYPLLELAAELHPGLPLRVSAFDFAPRAVALVRAKAAAHADGAVDAFVCDLAAGDVGDALPRRVGVGACHAATLVFVLSALAPESMPGAVRAVGACLAPGACVLVRDYAAGDLAEVRHMPARAHAHACTQASTQAWAYASASDPRVRTLPMSSHARPRIRPHARAPSRARTHTGTPRRQRRR